MRHRALTDTLRPLPAEDGGEAKRRPYSASQLVRRELARRHDVGVYPPARDRRFADPVAVIARDHDRIALGIHAGDDADMTAAAATGS